MERDLTKAHELFRESIRQLIRKEISPRIAEFCQQDDIPRDLWQRICELDILETVSPETFGGQTGESTLLGIAAEEIGKADVSLAGTLVPNAAFCMLMKYADASIQAQWLPGVIAGQKLSCIAVTESDFGTDAAAIQTSAVKVGDSYVLNGQKTAVGWGMAADVVLVMAKTQHPEGERNISCFLLPLPSSGVVRESIPDMGLHPAMRASIIMEDVRVPESHLIGDTGKGFQVIKEGLGLNRILVGLISVGAAQGIIDETISYVKQRKAFGHPIGKYEGVSFTIAEAATKLAAARSLCYRALGLKDGGFKHAKESAMCKWWATKVAVDVIHDALILHGHYGYSKDAMIEHRLRDVIGNELADGSPEGMKLTIVGELLGKEYLPYFEIAS